MDTSNRITLQMIADAAGVARSTVSKALHNAPRIPAQTRARIQRIAQEMGYRPVPAVSALMSQLRRYRNRSDLETVAFVTSFTHWNRGLYGGYFKGAGSRAAELGFRVEHVDFLKLEDNGPRLSGILRARGIRGVMIAPVADHRVGMSLDWEHFCPVAFGHTLRWPNCHRVGSNQYQTMMQLLYQLDMRGYRRIGYLLPASVDERIGNLFFAAFCVYQSHLPEASRVPPLRVEDPTPRECCKWLDDCKPDVIVSIEGHNLEWIEHAGLRIPEDISIAFFAARNLFSKGLAGMDQNTFAIGQAAMELVAEQLYENRYGLPEVQKVVHIAGCWCDGWTVIDKRLGPSLDWKALL